MGVKVVDLPDLESGLSEKHSSDLEGPLSIDLLQNRSPLPNAMESLMDQGMHTTRCFLHLSIDISA